MDRGIHTFNQLIANKINQKNRHLHELRLHNIKSSQNSRSFLSSSMNTRQNRKAQQLQQDKKTEIQKHNLMLFNKMRKIMSRQDPNNKPILQNHKHSNRISLDQIEIEEENRALYDRVHKQRSTINNKKLFQERQKQLNLLKFLGKFSSHSIQSLNAQNRKNLHTSQAFNKGQSFIESKKRSHTRPQDQIQNIDMDFDSNKKFRYQRCQADDEVVSHNSTRRKEGILRNKQKSALEQRQKLNYSQQISSKQTKQLRKMTMNPLIPTSAKDIILFKINKQINEKQYEIKILRKHLSYEIRCTLLNSSCLPITLQLGEQEGHNLLEQTNYNYKSIIDSLKLIDNSIVLQRGDSSSATENLAVVQPQQSKKMRNKLLYTNSSHISEQNEQQNFQFQLIAKKKPLYTNQLNTHQEEMQQNGQTKNFCIDNQKQVQINPLEANKSKLSDQQKYENYTHNSQL